jgi:hypothetical protein
MKPHLKSVEREATVPPDRSPGVNRELAIDDEAFGARIANCRYDLRKVPAERPACFRPQLNVIARLEGKAAKAVPFRFELPSSPQRQFIRGPRFHRRRIERQTMTLEELRKALRVSQEDMADILTGGQPAAAKLEKRADMHACNPRYYVEALGGTLEITARFPDASVVLTNIGERP